MDTVRESVLLKSTMTQLGVEPRPLDLKVSHLQLDHCFSCTCKRLSFKHILFSLEKFSFKFVISKLDEIELKVA